MQKRLMMRRQVLVHRIHYVLVSMRTGDLEDFPDRARGILHQGHFIGRKHEGFGFQDGLGKTRQCNRR